MSVKNPAMVKALVSSIIVERRKGNTGKIKLSKEQKSALKQYIFANAGILNEQDKPKTKADPRSAAMQQAAQQIVEEVKFLEMGADGIVDLSLMPGKEESLAKAIYKVAKNKRDPGHGLVTKETIPYIDKTAGIDFIKSVEALEQRNLDTAEKMKAAFGDLKPMTSPKDFFNAFDFPKTNYKVLEFMINFFSLDAAQGGGKDIYSSLTPKDKKKLGEAKGKLGKKKRRQLTRELRRARLERVIYEELNKVIVSEGVTTKSLKNTVLGKNTGGAATPRTRRISRSRGGGGGGGATGPRQGIGPGVAAGGAAGPTTATPGSTSVPQGTPSVPTATPGDAGIPQGAGGIGASGLPEATAGDLGGGFPNVDTPTLFNLAKIAKFMMSPEVLIGGGLLLAGGLIAYDLMRKKSLIRRVAKSGASFFKQLFKKKKDLNDPDQLLDDAKMREVRKRIKVFCRENGMEDFHAQYIEDKKGGYQVFWGEWKGKLKSGIEDANSLEEQFGGDAEAAAQAVSEAVDQNPDVSTPTKEEEQAIGDDPALADADQNVADQSGDAPPPTDTKEGDGDDPEAGAGEGVGGEPEPDSGGGTDGLEVEIPHSPKEETPEQKAQRIADSFSSSEREKMQDNLEKAKFKPKTGELGQETPTMKEPDPNATRPEDADAANADAAAKRRRTPTIKETDPNVTKEEDAAAANADAAAKRRRTPTMKEPDPNADVQGKRTVELDQEQLAQAAQAADQDQRSLETGGAIYDPSDNMKPSQDRTKPKTDALDPVQVQNTASQDKKETPVPTAGGRGKKKASSPRETAAALQKDVEDKTKGETPRQKKRRQKKEQYPNLARRKKKNKNKGQGKGKGKRGVNVMQEGKELLDSNKKHENTLDFIQEQQTKKAEERVDNWLYLAGIKKK